MKSTGIGKYIGEYIKLFLVFLSFFNRELTVFSKNNNNNYGVYITYRSKKK